MDNIKIGKYLKEKRINRGLSQKDIANECNVSHQAVSKWEKGESLPDISSLQSLSNFYNISIDEILAGETSTTHIFQKPFNNRNKEIIKITLTLFTFFVAFLPFLSNEEGSISGYQLLFSGDFGLGYMTLTVILAFLVFQITFSMFTIFRIISFSRENVDLNQSISIVLMLLVWFSIIISTLNPFPFVSYFGYLLSIYLVTLRNIKHMNVDDNYQKNPKYEPFAYIIIYFMVLSVLPLYLVAFSTWYQTLYPFVVPFTVIVYILAIATFFYGLLNRKKKFDIANNFKIISIHSMRILYILIFYLLYTESYFVEFSEGTYSGIMLTVVYVGFELFINSKYNQAVALKEKTIPILDSKLFSKKK